MKKTAILYIICSFIIVVHSQAQYNICDFINRDSRLYYQYSSFNKKHKEYECLDKGVFVSIREQAFAKHTYAYDSNYEDKCACYAPYTNIRAAFQTKINGKWTPYLVNSDTVKKLLIDFDIEGWYRHYTDHSDYKGETSKCLDSLKYYILEDLDLYKHVTQLAVLFQVPEKAPNDLVFLEKLTDKIINFKELDTVFIALEFDNTKKLDYFCNKLLNVLPKEKIKLLYLRGNFSNNKPKIKAKINIVFPDKFPELKNVTFWGWTSSYDGLDKIILDSSVFTNSPKLQTIEIGVNKIEIKFAKNKQYPNIDSMFGWFSDNNTIDILKHSPNIKFLSFVSSEILEFPEVLTNNPQLNVNCYDPDDCVKFTNLFEIRGNLPYLISKNVNIHSLKFIAAKNKFMPKSISNLPNLEYLVFEKCPKLIDFSNLENTNIKKLGLYKMPLGKLIPTLANVKSLDTLQLNFTEFMKLKDEDIIALEALKQIRYIDCGNYLNDELEKKYGNRLKQIKSILRSKTIKYKVRDSYKKI